MANMSYCRFENTYIDLLEFYQHIDEELSESEENYRKKLIKLCKKLQNITKMRNKNEHNK